MTMAITMMTMMMLLMIMMMLLTLWGQSWLPRVSRRPSFKDCQRGRPREVDREGPSYLKTFPNVPFFVCSTGWGKHRLSVIWRLGDAMMAYMRTMMRTMVMMMTTTMMMMMIGRRWPHSRKRVALLVVESAYCCQYQTSRWREGISLILFIIVCYHYQ